MSDLSVSPVNKFYCSVILMSVKKIYLLHEYYRVNFKKNEKNYNAENSEVFKMVQEADKEPKTPEPG